MNEQSIKHWQVFFLQLFWRMYVRAKSDVDDSELEAMRDKFPLRTNTEPSTPESLHFRFSQKRYLFRFRNPYFQIISKKEIAYCFWLNWKCRLSQSNLALRYIVSSGLSVVWSLATPITTHFEKRPNIQTPMSELLSKSFGDPCIRPVWSRRTQMECPVLRASVINERLGDYSYILWIYYKQWKWWYNLL